MSEPGLTTASRHTRDTVRVCDVPSVVRFPVSHGAAVTLGADVARKPRLPERPIKKITRRKVFNVVRNRLFIL